ncbi:MAG: response regulator transcription factor [Alphaproteobacteria bacterium]
MTEKPIIDLFIIDDNAELAEALKLFFESKKLTVKIFTSPTKALDELVPAQVGCVITDYEMPEMNGDLLTEKLKKKDNLLPVIFITGKGSIPRAVKSIKSGGVALFEKPLNNEKLYQAVIEALSVNDAERENRSRVADMLANAHLLTPHEVNILKLLALGLSNKEVALKLDISYRTVEVHRSHIMEKLKAKSLPDLVRISDMI